MQKNPSIFNDVIGPVMRGPSSSHTAASWRIAKICMDILGEPLKNAVIDFDKDGAWASNFREQGTTLGIDGGLLGIDMADDRMMKTEQIATEMGVSITYEINAFKTKHVNTVRLKLEGIKGARIQILAVSLGGGAFEVQDVNGFKVKICGDFHETLFATEARQPSTEDILTAYPEAHTASEAYSDENRLITLKSSKALPEATIEALQSTLSSEKAVIIAPVLPIIAGSDNDLPFSTIASLVSYAQTEALDLGQLGLLYEQHQSGLSSEAVVQQMHGLVTIIEKSIQTGLSGTHYADRILPQQSHLIGEAQNSGKILQNSIVNNIVANVSAIMESKSAMEVIVAVPTAGSCGTVGGVLRAVADDMGASHDELINAYFAAGLVGAYFAMGPGFSAEEHGCQVETGASSGMAAAGITQLFGGSAEQALGAASMAIQNLIGLVCDPIADRVEAPCLGKNISAAVNALTSATMACSGFNALIPLDEVIGTVSNVSAQMPTCVKCTGKGGLAITKTACSIKEKLKKSQSQ